jgi:hypothetical protein
MAALTLGVAMRRINLCWAAVRYRHPERIRLVIRGGVRHETALFKRKAKPSAIGAGR